MNTIKLSKRQQVVLEKLETAPPRAAKSFWHVPCVLEDGTVRIPQVWSGSNTKGTLTALQKKGVLSFTDRHGDTGPGGYWFVTLTDSTNRGSGPARIKDLPGHVARISELTGLSIEFGDYGYEATFSVGSATYRVRGFEGLLSVAEVDKWGAVHKGYDLESDVLVLDGEGGKRLSTRWPEDFEVGNPEHRAAAILRIKAILQILHYYPEKDYEWADSQLSHSVDNTDEGWELEDLTTGLAWTLYGDFGIGECPDPSLEV